MPGRSAIPGMGNSHLSCRKYCEHHGYDSGKKVLVHRMNGFILHDRWTGQPVQTKFTQFDLI